MSSSSDRFKAETAKLSSQVKLYSVNESLLKALLPKAASKLASCLSDDEKEVLVFLVMFGSDSVRNSKSSISTVHSPRRPWKLSVSKGEIQKDGCPSCTMSAAFAASYLFPEEWPSKRSSSYLSIAKGGLVCDCFSRYSKIWSRWNASPNRDLINDVLGVIETVPQYTPLGSDNGKKKKKKKRLEEKRVMQDKEEKDQTSELKLFPRKCSDLLPTTDKDCYAARDDNSQINISPDHGNIFADKSVNKKSLFRGLKQKHKLRSINLAPAFVSEGTENEPSLWQSTASVLETAGEAVVSEMPKNVTVESSISPSLEVPAGKIEGKMQQHARRGKRRNNQILPLDCVDVVDKQWEQETAFALQETQMSMSPRPPDAGLGGRGFLARVFPDALGRVASRLWDLVSVRLHVRTVEYQ